MGVLSLFRKDKQDAAAAVPDETEFQTRAEEESNAVRGRRKRRKGKGAEDPVDPTLPEKKRARRRLIGAIALVLAAVIGLPMVLDSEPKPLAEDIAIQIPAKDKPLRSSTESDKPAASVPRKPALEASLDKNEEIVALPPAPKADAAPKAVGQTPEAQPPALAAATQKSVQKTADRTDAKPEARGEAKPAAPAREPVQDDDTARARAILEGRTEAAAEKTRTAFEKTPGKFMLQVAALTSQDKVNELQSKLKSAGIRSQTQKVATQSGERIRVRIGPFASKEEADKMKARLGKMGLSGTLVPA